MTTIHLSSPQTLRTTAGHPRMTGPLRYSVAAAAHAVYGGEPDHEVARAMNEFTKRALTHDADAHTARSHCLCAPNDRELAEALRRELLTRATEREPAGGRP